MARFARILLAATLTAGATAVVVGGAAAPASAAPNLDCQGAIYLTDSSTTAGDARILRVGLDGTVSTTSVYDPTTGSTGNPNQLGIGLNGARVINTDRATNTIVNYNPATGSRTTLAAAAVGTYGIAGAVNPKNGLYYYGGYDSSQLVLYVYDPVANTTTGPVARVNTPNMPSGGTNGDIAFDNAGRLFYVSSSSSTVSLYRLADALPTTGTSGTAFTATRLSTTSGLSSAVNGIAVGSDGFLYIGQSNQVRKVNAVTGELVAGGTIALPAGVSSTDLASCASPGQLTVKVNLPDGRVNTTDQFTSTFSGGTYDGTPAGPSGTTTGTDTGLQNTPAEYANGITLQGESYTTSVSTAGTTNLANYVVTYECTDDVTGAVLASGAGTTVSVSPAAQQSVTCVYTARRPDPRIALDKSVNPATFTAVGQTLTYTFAVENTGNLALSNLQLADPMPGLSAPTCAPVAIGGTLPVGGTTTCSATYTVTQADVNAGVAKTNTATVRGTPPAGYGTTVSAADSASATYGVVGPTATDNTANTPFNTPVTLPTRLDDTPGTSPIVTASTRFTSAAATNGGKTLVTPEGTWQVQADGSVVFTPAAGYTGTTPLVEYRVTDQNGLTDTATLRVTVRPGPSAVPDSATTPQNVNVNVSPLGNDTPGRTAAGNAGSFDPATLLFPTTGQPGTMSNGGRTLTVPGEGVYTIDPATGVVTFDPEPQFTGVATPVAYVVRDSFGNQTGSTITITVTPTVPQANDDAAKTPFDTPVTLTPLANDTAGHPSAPITPGSIVFTSPDPGSNGLVKTVPGEGVWTINPDHTVTFDPANGFTGPTTPVEYEITDANGTTDTANLTVTVGKPPLAAPDVATTPQDTNVVIDPLTNDRAGDQGSPCTATGTPPGCDTGTLDPTSVRFPAAGQPGTVSNGGRTLTVPGEGVYTIDPVTGRVTFDPEPAFTGEATPVVYQVTDSYGTTVTSTITPTVTPITPEANDDAAVTRFDTPVTLPAVLDDVPGDPQGGAPAPLVPGATVFTVGDQPAGAVRSADGKTLTVPGEGVWTINANGSATFTPEPGFTGQTTPVTYRIEDANGTTDTALLTVIVRPGPVAAPDTATTPQDTNVDLVILGNDVASEKADGSDGDFDPTTVVFPTTGQPAGAVVSPGGKTITVPGEGVYTIDADGVVTFDPEPAFAGTTTPVRYEVLDDAENLTGSTITVTVTPAQVDPPEADLSIEKTASSATVAGGGTLDYTLKVTNDGPDAAVAPVITDDVPAELEVIAPIDPRCTVTGQLVECTLADLASGASTSVVVHTRARATASGTSTGPEHQLDISRVETAWDLDPGESQTVSVSCPGGAVLTDVSWNIASVDQGTGTPDDVEIHAAGSTSVGSGSVEFTNHATGRAQGQVFGACLALTTSSGDNHSHQLTAGSLVQRTDALPEGTTTVTLLAGGGNVAIAPGYRITSGSAVLVGSEQTAAGWELTYLVPAGETATVVSSIRPLATQLAAAGSPSHTHALSFTHPVRTVSLPVGASTHRVSCDTGSKGIVATYDGPFRMGSIPEPINRDFTVFNPGPGTASATIDLLCLSLTTAPVAPAAVTVVNTAEVHSATYDPDPTDNDASASVSLTPGAGAPGARPVRLVNFGQQGRVVSGVIRSTTSGRATLIVYRGAKKLAVKKVKVQAGKPVRVKVKVPKRHQRAVNATRLTVRINGLVYAVRV